MSQEADAFRVAIMALMENLAGVREACGGYRKQLEDDGFDAHSAQHMAMELHAYLLDILRQTTLGGRP